MGAVVQDSSMLHVCAAPGCSTFTMGRLCVTHEPAGVARVFVRGRPFVQQAAVLPAALAELPVQGFRLPRPISA